MNNIIKIYIVLIILFTTAQLIKAEKKQLKKINIAIIELQTNNCSPSLGRAVTDILAGKIFKSKQFILLEKNQIDMIIKQKNFTKKNSIETDYAAQLGQTLEVEKIIVGSISKIDNYTLEIRVIDVKTNKIEISISQNADNISEIKEVLNNVNLKINRHFSGYSPIKGDYDLSIAPSYIRTGGDLKDGLKDGYGANLNFFINHPFNLKYPFMVSAGFYTLKPEMDSIDYAYLMPLQLHIIKKFKLGDNFSFLPSIGAGCLFSRINYDKVDYRASGDYEYSAKFFINPMLTARAELNLLIFHRYYFYTAPFYSLFFDRGHTGQLMGIDLGIKILF